MIQVFKTDTSRAGCAVVGIPGGWCLSLGMAADQVEKARA